MNENINEIYRTLQTSQNKYVYFKLAAAMAAIGFAITQTKSIALNTSQIPLGISILAWGLSFLFGLLNREYYNSILYANFNYIKMKSGQIPIPRTETIQTILRLHQKVLCKQKRQID